MNIFNTGLLLKLHTYSAETWSQSKLQLPMQPNTVTCTSIHGIGKHHTHVQHTEEP